MLDFASYVIFGEAEVHAGHLDNGVVMLAKRRSILLCGFEACYHSAYEVHEMFYMPGFCGCVVTDV